MERAPVLPSVVENDRKAMEEAIARFAPLLWSLVLRMGIPPDHAETLVQRIFGDVVRSAPKFDRHVASEETFVVMITRRRILEYRRTLPRSPSLPPVLDLRRPPGTPPVDACPEATHAAMAIDALTAEDRLTLVMAACQGYSYDEIGRAASMSLEHVQHRARTAILRVREALGSVAGPSTPRMSS